MSKMQEEFDKLFSEYREMPIAIYGTGNNAQLLLENVKGYQFTNLVSRDCIGDVVCGKQVVALADAIESSKMLIIAAIPSSTAIIYERIKEEIPDDYLVFDMRGNRLYGAEKYKENTYWECTEARLRDLIQQHEVISFDVFDTLITRTVLNPRDIFRIVEFRLRAIGIDIPFYEWRIAAEQKCNCEVVAPTLMQIYEKLQAEFDLTFDVATRARELELEVEMENILPRRKMLEILAFACSMGKDVYFTSDMYLGAEEIRKLLQKSGVRGNVPILVSCEQGKTKENGELYKLLKEQVSEKTILHIGDNENADIVMAQRQGMSAFQVKRGYEMLAESSWAFLLDNVSTQDDMQLLGRIVAEICNNPFALGESKGKILINDYRKLAWSFVPITVLLMSLIIEKAKEYDLVLFASRDGFFLEELYARIRKERQGDLACGKYFYVSRSAVSSASVVHEDDIMVLCSKILLDTKLNLRIFVQNQFHIEVSDEFDITIAQAISLWGEEGLFEKIRNCKEAIISKSTECRNNYLKYAKSVNVDVAEKIAIVDIVTHGTLIYGVSNILSKEVDLLALGTSGIPNKYISDEKRVASVYGNVNEKIGNKIYSFSALSELHLFLEMIYSSREGQLYSFSETGEPIMVQGTEYNAELLCNVQEEMLKIMQEIGDEYYRMNLSKDFALACLKLLYHKYSDMSENVADKFVFQDPYDGNMQECNLIDILSN